jgi:protein-L-isoaspartate(D-aspartate) O-methyltransferase
MGGVDGVVIRVPPPGTTQVGDAMTDFAALRRNMVDCQLRTFDVTDRAVLAAMDQVPRELFVPPARREMAYIDQAQALDAFGAAGRTLLAPMVCGRMLQTLDVQPGQSFLDYACGTGYTGAVAAAMGAQVTAYDPSAALRAMARTCLAEAGASQAAAASVSVRDGMPDGPFDLIFVNGAADDEPLALSARLSADGRMIVVMGRGRSGRVTLFQRSGDVVRGRPVFDAAATLLPEFARNPSFAL